MKKFKLHLIALVALFIMPFNAFAYSMKVIPGGQNIGIKLNIDGILIVGFYQVNNKYIANDAGFEIGDRIIKINNKTVTDIETMINEIDKDTTNNKINVSFIRNNKEHNTDLALIKDKNNIYKTGLYVKDQINGIGTLTYIDPTTNIYGALGHEIADKNTMLKIEIKDGHIYDSNVTGINKSENGKPGEKKAQIDINNQNGIINKNEETGIYGKYTDKPTDNNLVDVATKDEIVKGKAFMKTVIEGKNEEMFEIEILKIDKKTNTKNILFEITDKRLIDKTNGIVQGMSGSPIFQNNKIIGAVTHIIVNDSKKGYGIFITTMLEDGEQ